MDSPLAVPPVPELVLSDEEALALAQSLLDEGRAFFAHEVLESQWKAAPADKKDFWQGLAQLCVGVTHLQRGNTVGAVRLLRRGALHLEGPLVGWSLQACARIDAGDLGVPDLRLPGYAVPQPERG